MERMHAKPFVGSLEGHRDGVYCMARHMGDLKLVASGSADGEARVWNLATRKCIWKADAHSKAWVKGVGFVPQSQSQFITVGDDKLVKLWDMSSPTPTSIFQGSNPFT